MHPDPTPQGSGGETEAWREELGGSPTRSAQNPVPVLVHAVSPSTHRQAPCSLSAARPRSEADHLRLGLF